MDFIVSYDVLARADAEVKAQLKALGWIDCIKLDDGDRRRLPNSTLLRYGIPDGAAAWTSWNTAVAAARRRLGIAANIVDKVFIISVAGPGTLQSDERCND